MLDLLIIRPGADKQLYQDLSKSLSGIEPPLWAALLAAFIRDKGFEVKLIDMIVDSEKYIDVLIKDNPELIAVVVSGTNPSASTMNMVGARNILEQLKKTADNIPTILIGLHPSALPEKTLMEESVSMVCQGEGFFTLLDLVSGRDVQNIKGLWYKKNGEIYSNPRANLVNPDDLAMPVWDLLPMGKYRAHNWHCFGNLDKRDSYAVIYTSLGCPFSCTFCCINAIFGENKIRYRSPQKVIEEIEYLVRNYNIRNMKIMDEMFDLNEEHVIRICDLIIEKKFPLNIWAYSRVDTINERKLKRMKAAGINWLGIGFESGSKRIRNEVSKGNFNGKKIADTVHMIRKSGINIGGNFIFGLPGDDLKSMQETFDLAKKINSEYSNFYVAMAYPGSKLYKQAQLGNKYLSDNWLSYSQYGYNTIPFPTEYLSSSEILRFRDNAFHELFGSKCYQDMILNKFGRETMLHVQNMVKYRLKRALLGD